MRPTLIVNPATDDVFGTFAQMLVADGARSIDDLERRLRSIYPKAVVHARVLAGEPAVVWYVYREGHWVASRPASEPTGGMR